MNEEKTNIFVDALILNWVESNIPGSFKEFELLSAYHCCDFICKVFSFNYCFKLFSDNGLHFVAHIVEKEKLFFQDAVKMPPSQITRLERAIKSAGLNFGYNVAEWRKIRKIALDNIAQCDWQRTSSLPAPLPPSWVGRKQIIGRRLTVV